MTNVVGLVSGFISLVLTIWFVTFTVLTLMKLDKIIVLLDKNK